MMQAVFTPPRARPRHLGHRSHQTQALRSALVVAVALSLLGGCPAAARGPDIGRLPVLTSDDPKAELELREAAQLATDGKLDAAIAAYRRFLDQRGSDRLRPVAELALGRILLERGDHAGAGALFANVQHHPDVAIAEQGRFYGGIVEERVGHHRAAIDALQPMVGRTIEPRDTALLLRTLAEAYVNDGRVADAIVTLQALSEDNVPEADRKAARTRIVQLAEHNASPADVRRLFDELAHDSYAFRYVAVRAVKDADAARDVERTRALLDAIKDAGIPFDDTLGAIALRAERPNDANPRAVGAILSLSGRARKVGELAVRGLMLAANLPPQGPPTPETPQLVLRDDALDPATAVEAVNELVSAHRVIAIIGPLDANVALAAGKRAQELGVPMIALTPAGDLPALGPMVFRYFPTPESEARALAQAARKRGAQRIATLYPQSAYGEAMRATFEREAQSAGLEVGEAFGYAATATSFGDVIARVAKARFDALFIPDTAQKLALIAPALAAAGLWNTAPGQHAPATGRAITTLSPSIAFDAELPRLAGRYLQGALVSSPFDATAPEGPAHDFAARFQARFGATPDAFAAFAHDAYQLVRASVDAGANTRQRLAEQLATTRPKNLVGPSPGFSAAREPQRATRVLELSGDAFAALPD